MKYVHLSELKNYNAMTEKTRYTDEELQEFKELILEKLEKARRDYDALKAPLSGRSGTPCPTAGEVHRPFGGCPCAGGKQDLRHLPPDRETDPERPVARRAPCHVERRGKRKRKSITCPL